MGLSYFLEQRFDGSYAHTNRVRAGYELRDYEGVKLVGMSVQNTSWANSWLLAKSVKENLDQKGLEVRSYPFFIRDTQNERKIFFILENAPETDIVSGVELVRFSSDVAFSGFLWYPTQKSIHTEYARIFSALEEEGSLDISNEAWTEVKSPWYIIPFMMHNGVFIPFN